MYHIYKTQHTTGEELRLWGQTDDASNHKPLSL